MEHADPPHSDGSDDALPGASPSPSPDVHPDVLRAAVDALPDRFFVKDAEGRYVFVNTAFAESLGLPPDRIIGRTDSQLRPPEPARVEQQQDQLARIDGLVARRSGWMLEADGQRRLVHTVRAPLHRPTSAATEAGASHVVGLHRDLSEADRATDIGPEEAESLIEAVPAAIYWKDVDGTLAGANAAFARFVGARETGEITGRREEDFAWRALDHARIDEEVARLGVARRDVRRREVDRFSRRRWTETTVVPRRDASGRITGVLGMRRDVTAQVNALRSAERTAATADQASRAKSGFLTRMSHAVRTPLTSLLGFAELAADPTTNGHERTRHLERVRDNGWQVLALVDDLLDLARIEAGRLAIRPAAFDVRAMVHEVTDAARHRLAATGGSLEVHFGQDLPASMHNDPSRVRQILVALVDRAIRDSDPPRLTVTVERGADAAGSGIRIEVCDDAPSIDADELATRLKPVDGDDDQGDLNGRGLALATSWAIAELLGGRIDASPRAADAQGQPTGNRFVLRVPERLAAAASDPGSAESTTERSSDPWQRVEDAARSGLAWFADPSTTGGPDTGDRPAAADARKAAAPPTAPIPRDLDARPSTAGLDTARAAAADDAPRDVPGPPPSPGPPGDAGAPTSASRPAPPIPPSAEGARILLAEDTPDTARFLKLVLESAGHTVTVAIDGQAALDHLAAEGAAGESFDLLITDVQMPRLDGLELTRQARTSGRRHPIIALSAHATEEHRRLALQAGCDDHLGKPIKPDTLIDLVAHWLATGSRSAQAA